MLQVLPPTVSPGSLTEDLCGTERFQFECSQSENVKPRRINNFVASTSGLSYKTAASPLNNRILLIDSLFLGSPFTLLTIQRSRKRAVVKTWFFKVKFTFILALNLRANNTSHQRSYSDKPAPLSNVITAVPFSGMCT